MSKFQGFLMKQMLKSKMKNIPEAEQEKIFELIEKNPDFFQKIGNEIQEKIKSGMDQNTATQEIMKKYSSELQNLAK